MFRPPSTDDIVEAAASIGIRLSPPEAEVFNRHLPIALEALDRFVQARMDDGRPPLLYPQRDRGHRPSADDDPHNAWVWRCHITGAEDGLLAGKTFSFKDHIAVAGVPMTLGSFALEGLVPDFDATIVTRILAAGGTIVGKNTMDGLAGAPGCGHVGDYWRPKNPHAHERLSGGSSSGSAVAVVAREVDIAFGGDQGGSIRIPAAWSGAVGLKPTFGLVSHFGIAFGSPPSFDYTGPMALTVEDVAAALQATAGYDGLDPRQDRTVPERIDALSALAEGVQGVRIGVVEEGFTEPIDDDVRDGVMAALDVLERNGAVVTKVSIPDHLQVNEAAAALYPEGCRAIFDTGPYGAFARTYYPAEVTATINRFYRHHADQLHALAKFRLLVSEFSRRTYHGMVYAKAHNVRRGFIRSYDSALADVDVLAMPTCVVPAPVYEDPGSGLAAVERALSGTGDLSTAIRNTWGFSYTGHPAIAVPCGKTSQGLPISLQLSGRFYDDPLLLRVAFAYEHSVDWESVVTIHPGVC